MFGMNPFARKEQPVRLNRHGRRRDAAMTRKSPMTRAKAKWQKMRERQAIVRRNGLEFRLNKVREATRKRNGRCNNPRFN